MDTLVTGAVMKLPIFSRTRCKDRISQFPSCSRLENTCNVKVNQNHVSNADVKEEKNNDVWELFKEAQQNILYLNKQRLKALEELSSVKNERHALLNRIKMLEMGKQANVERDEFTIRSQLLLRIDSLILSGVIGSTEAYELRRLVMDARSSLVNDMYDNSSKNHTEFLSMLRHHAENSKRIGLHIMHICTEMSPVTSVGSLASYITGLSCLLQKKGNLVEVILPKYACLKLDEVVGLQEVGNVQSYFNGGMHENRIWMGVVNGVGVTFLEPIYYASFFDHDKVYGCSNDFERFAYFSRASLDYLVKSGKKPDVIHIHNWQTSIVGPLFWDVFVHQGLERTKIVLTCQGLDSNCLEKPEKLALSGLDPSKLFRPDRLQDNEKSHLVNILKGGVVYSNRVIALSMLSKDEIIGGYTGGLEHTLAIHRDKVMVAPFGLDESIWDPSSDNHIPRCYSAHDLEGKSICKLALQHRVDFPSSVSTIVVGCICSDPVDLNKLKTLISVTSRRGVGVQFVVMGSLLNKLSMFPEQFSGENVRFVQCDHGLFRSILSGSDIMLCPSFDYETPVTIFYYSYSLSPLRFSNLTLQLKAMKYGAAPLCLHGSSKKHKSESNKLSQFINLTFESLSFGEAINEIMNDPSRWRTRIRDAMVQDMSWDCDAHVAAYAAVKML